MIIPIELGENSYNITLERGAISKASDIFGIKGRVLVVTDTGVPSQYAKAVASQFKDSVIFTFEQGESNKNFDTYMSICKALTQNGFTRKDAVIAVGGGVVGDMSGFAAATYMRGISFYNIPTTVLSQVDSSIGGKTAIDFMGVKNIIGAFHQPKGVIIDPDVLSTLPERQIKNGLAESIKMGMCFNKELFELFKSDDYIKNIDKIIELSLKIKKYVVEKDEKESGLRKSLNFGHTIGHGIESFFDGEYYHGECVAMGIIPMCDESIKQQVESVMKNVGFVTDASFDKEKVEEIICHDKKAVSDSITVVRCGEIGSFYFENMTAEKIMNLI